ncbi:PKD domain protein [Thermoplasmatales archaeon SCGC AB-540-F20]|nr:PKD domain protein [Thermoplasmatales archaeon SCGC AB-540-F20]
MLLFVVLSITSGISEYIGKMSNLSTEEALTSFPLGNDYVLAYWKSDECNGTTLWDCSGHNYNGTIYGVTWTPGCCLVFDGLDDYVDFDNHSVGLGFNKTDDLVFSFYFKSSTNHKGMIYSMSTDYGSNPEFHIFLDSNGSIGVEIKGTSCGFELFAAGSYNDDTWHYVEIIFYGNISKPTIDIYVDNQLDVSVTDWMCAFSNDEFDLVKIGRRSHTQIDYFEGIIDELKIIKYPGGNKQNPPEISGPTTGEPGVEYNFTFVTNDPENDSIWIRFNWSDGDIGDWIGPYESGEEVIMGLEFPENGTYRIGAQSKDAWGCSNWSYHTIRIGNEAPDAPDIEGPTVKPVPRSLPKQGEPINYTFKSTDPDGDNVSYYIDWNDGDFEDWFGPHESGEEVVVNHTWSAEGVYTVRAKAKDIYGAESDWGTLEVTIPKNKQSHNIWFLHWLERFPILQKILDVLMLNN